LQLWNANASNREAKSANDNIQKGRKDLGDGNVVAVESRIDSLLTNSDSSNAGIESAEDAERRISQL